MHLDKFVKSSAGKILMSMILGIGLATLFRVACKGKQCRVVKAPPMAEIDDQIYKYNDKCYKLEKNAIKCDKERKTVKIA